MKLVYELYRITYFFYCFYDYGEMGRKNNLPYYLLIYG